MDLSIYKSHAVEVRYLAAYDTVLALWPTSFESRFVTTSFGSTHVIICGPGKAEPLVLLHGFGVNASMWIPMIATLSQTYRVYALDTIGDLGKSKLTHRLEKPDDYIVWLKDVIHELQIEPVNLVGFSQGGWIALNFAIHSPQTLSKLILISPNAGLVSLRPEFMMRLILMSIFPVALLIDSWARWNSQAWDNQQPYFKSLSELTRAGIAGQNRSRSGVMPTTFSDSELQEILCPVLMLVGQNEVVNNPQAALARAKRLIPSFEGAIIEQARHMLPFDQPEMVCDRIASFMTSEIPIK
jgi:pimeloyl-ACP methyl ester carboxylesterase